MDEADRASDLEEMSRQAAIIARRRIGPVCTGVCLFCGEVVEKPLRWCGPDCREEWERRDGK